MRHLAIAGLFATAAMLGASLARAEILKLSTPDPDTSA